MKPTPTICAFCIGAALVAIGSRAHSETVAGDAIAAQALFDEAKRLTQEGKYSEACVKFEESQRLDPGSGTLLNLADCLERVGRRASAWNYFLEAGALAEAADNVERASEARARAATLESTLGKITIIVGPLTAAQSPVIRRDGLVVGSAQWSVAMPVDSGRHEISAAATDKQSWSTTVETRDQGQVVRIEIPTLAELSAVSKPVETNGSSPTSPLVPTSAARHNEPESARGLSPQKTGAIVSASFGLVGVTLGTAFGLQSKSARDEASAYCRGNQCWDEKGVQLRSDAISAGNLSTIMFVVGAAGFAGGAVLWLADPSSHSRLPQIGIGLGRLSAGMAF